MSQVKPVAGLGLVSLSLCLLVSCLLVLHFSQRTPPSFSPGKVQPDLRHFWWLSRNLVFSFEYLSEQKIISWHACRFTNKGCSWIRNLVTKGVSFPSSLHQLGQQTLHTLRVQAAAFFFYSQECRLQATPSCNQGNQFQVIKVWLFPGTEAMCAREKWGQGMG